MPGDRWLFYPWSETCLSLSRNFSKVIANYREAYRVDGGAVPALQATGMLKNT